MEKEDILNDTDSLKINDSKCQKIDTLSKNPHKALKLSEINSEFEENIYFNHYFSIFHKIEFSNNIASNEIPYIMSREFLYSYFEDRLYRKTPSEETKMQIIGKIKQYSTSHNQKFNKIFLENYDFYAEIIGIEKTSNLLIPSLARIVDETVAMKIIFLRTLSKFIDYLNKNDDIGIYLLKNNIINILEELYHPRGFEIKDDEMKNLLFDNFIKAAKIIIPNDKKNYILNMIISFGYEESNSPEFVLEHKILCIKFIDKLCEIFGEANAEKYLLPQLNFFADDENEEMKKEVLISLPNLCKLLTIEIIRVKIYKLIKKINTDNSWRLRKICIEVITKILTIYKKKSQLKNKNLSIKHYVTFIEKFISDNQKYVRNTLLGKLGEIISSLSKNELSKKLFDFYINSAEEYYHNKESFLRISLTSETSVRSISGRKITKDEVIFYFAYNFPAVIFCYGAEMWSKLKNIYYNLAQDTNPKIRMSLISSFYEVCKILGKKIIEKDLMIIYDIFLESEDLNEKKIAQRNLPKILGLVSNEIKKKYLKYFDSVSIFKDDTGEEVKNFYFIHWKDKIDVIEGILIYYNLYENEIIYSSIIRQCIIFCLDKIYKVRAKSSKVLATLILYLYNNNYQKEKLFKILDTFAMNKKSQQRINFVKMCKIFVENQRIYLEKINDLILNMVRKEKVLNVKIALSKLLKKIICNKESFLFNDMCIHHICQILVEQDNRSINDIFQNCNIQKNNIFPQNNNDFNFEYYDNSYFKEEFNINLDNESEIIEKDYSNFEEDSKDFKEKSEDFLIKKINTDNACKSMKFKAKIPINENERLLEGMKTKTYSQIDYNNEKEFFGYQGKKKFNFSMNNEI